MKSLIVQRFHQIRTRRLLAAAWLAMMALMLAPASHADYAFVTLTEGALNFAPATLVTPIVTAAVAAVVAGAVLYVLWLGVRAIKRFAKG